MAHRSRPVRYRVIADSLAAEIRSHVYPLGSNLPVEHELAARFRTSRQTIREALRILGDRGLIVRRPGFGTTVVNTGARTVFKLSLGSLGQLLSYPPGVRRRHLECGPYFTDEETAELLGCSVGAEWVRIRAIRFVEQSELPLCWVDLYLAPRFSAIAKQRGAERSPLIEQIEETFGERVESAEIDFAVGRVAKEMSALLGVRSGSPALRIVRRYLGARDPLEITVSTHPEGRYTHCMKLAT